MTRISSRILPVPLLFLVLVAGCAAPPPDLEAARQAIRAADLAFGEALRSGDAERFKSFIADDATFFGQGLYRGPQQVLERWRPLLGPDATTRLTWEPEQVRVSAAADLGYSIGRYQIRSEGESGEPEVGYGRYVTIWSRAADGSWKALVDIGTPPGSEPPGP